MHCARSNACMCTCIAGRVYRWGHQHSRHPTLLIQNNLIATFCQYQRPFQCRYMLQTQLCVCVCVCVCVRVLFYEMFSFRTRKHASENRSHRLQYNRHSSTVMNVQQSRHRFYMMLRPVQEVASYLSDGHKTQQGSKHLERSHTYPYRPNVLA